MPLHSRLSIIPCLASLLAAACGGESGRPPDDVPPQETRHSVTMRLRNQSPAVGLCTFVATWSERGEAQEATALAGEYVTPEQVRTEVRTITGATPVTFTVACEAQNRPDVAAVETQVSRVLTKACALDAAYRIVRLQDETVKPEILYVSDC